jgi:hypothetical protein
VDSSASGAKAHFFGPKRIIHVTLAHVTGQYQQKCVISVSLTLLIFDVIVLLS